MNAATAPANPSSAPSLAWPLAALGFVAALQLVSLFHRAVNWDEYWFLGQVHELAQGQLTRPLQTIHTRLFGWLTALPGSDIDAMIAARVAMLGCLVVATLAIVGIAERFAPRRAALFAALAYLSAGFVFQHGHSFRVDPLATMLLMAALWALLRAPLRWGTVLGIGLLLGLAAMVTIKVVLYAGAFAGLAWLRWSEHGRSPAAALRLVGIGVAALAAFGALYLYHNHDLAHGAQGMAKSVLRTSFGYMFGWGVPDYWRMMLKAAATAPLLTLLIAAFPFVLWRLPASGAEKIALLGLFSPLATLLFYHNTAAYYYVYMLAPVAAAAAIAIPLLTARLRPPVLALAFAANPVVIWAAEAPSVLPAQRQLAEAAEALFPQPVGYFDWCAQLPSLAKRNMFMTPWGIDLYQHHEVPSLEETMARESVPLVVENEAMFTQALRGSGDRAVFTPRDAAVLRASYVPFWGPFWLAGQRIPAGSTDHAFDLKVPGPYTVGDAPLVIDGVARRAGEVVELARGVHRIGGNRAAPVLLLWGRNLKPPAKAPPAQPWFVDF